MTSVLLVDDHPVVRQGCRQILTDMGIHELFEATTVPQAYESYMLNKPDVVVVDLTFSGDDLGGLTLINRIASQKRKTRILAFSMHNDPTIVARALKHGAMSYVLKDTSSLEFAEAFRDLMQGKPHLSHGLALQVAMLATQRRTPVWDMLTEREAQILTLLGKGHNYSAIAHKLSLSYKTVTNATSSIRGKLKIESLAELIRFAVDNDLDEAGPRYGIDDGQSYFG